MTETPPPPAPTPYAPAAGPDTTAAAVPAAAVPAAAAPATRGPYRTATIVVLVVTALALVFHFGGEQLLGSANFADSSGGFGVYIAEFFVSVALFVTALVLRSRTRRAGLPRGLATTAVVLTSVLLGIVILTAVFLVGALLLLILAFTGG